MLLFENIFLDNRQTRAGADDHLAFGIDDRVHFSLAVCIVILTDIGDDGFASARAIHQDGGDVFRDRIFVFGKRDGALTVFPVHDLQYVFGIKARACVFLSGCRRRLPSKELQQLSINLFFGPLLPNAAHLISTIC